MTLAHFHAGMSWRLRLLIGGLLILTPCSDVRVWATESSMQDEVTQGALRIEQADGSVVECPLRHTDVQAEIAGFIARVRVRQTFYNPTDEKIEAVYVFPLPHEAAVDQMTMMVGERKIVGQIQRRADALRIYQQALAAGQTAALLEQERPNIFTQSVGNIGPAQEVVIEISYVDALRYDQGQYEFHFPMVVGPRYNPGAPIAMPAATPEALQGKVSPPTPDSTRVPDASRISPPVLKPGYRNGHDISISVTLDAAVPIHGLRVPSHRTDIKKKGQSRATVALSPADSLPNKDFVLRYDVVGERPSMAMLAHTDQDSRDARRLGPGYFMLMIQPKDSDELKKSPPREIVFLVDVSGSMSGQPTAKVRETMESMLKLCRPIDTVQVITFASQAFQLFPKPVNVTEDNIRKAVGFARNLRGGGGTEMLKGVKLAIDAPLDEKRMRVVVMLTDGYIGNEAEILEHVGQNCGDQIRFWAVGIGSSPNMFLVDGAARQGGGMGKKLGLEEDSAALAHEVVTRIQRAQLAKLHIDWGGLKVAETYPAKLPELWAGRPVIVYGRYHGGGDFTVNVSGEVEGQPTRWPVEVTLPDDQAQHDVLAKVWARQKIESLMQQSFYGGSPAVEEEVTAIALDYALMSQYTSFVAVDQKESGEVSPNARPPRRMAVPVPLPEGTRWEGFFGRSGEKTEPMDLAWGLKKLSDTSSRTRRESVDSFYRLAVPGMASGPAPMNNPARGSRRKDGLAAAPNPIYGFVPAQAHQVQLGAMLSNGASVTYRASGGLGGGGLGGGGNSYGGGLGGMGGGFGDTMLSGLRGGTTVLGRQPIRALSLGVTPRFSRPLSDSDYVQEYEAESLRQAGGEIDEAVMVYQGHIAELQSEAKKAGEDAAEVYKPEKRGNDQPQTEEYRAELLKACFLDRAAMNAGMSNGAISSSALQSLINFHRQEVARWQKELPQLENKLNVVLRDMSVAEAIEALAEASGVAIKMVPGSDKDAAELLAVKHLRVNYLDLRHATLAEALDWLLSPNKMSWRATQGIVTAGVDRRLAGVSAWVYDVQHLALPASKELGDLKDPQKIAETVAKATRQFLEVMRGTIRTSESTAVTWFAPGQLLVIGDQRDQAAVAELVSALSDPEAGKSLTGVAKSLHAATVERARQAAAAKKTRLEAQHYASLAEAHYQFCWSLLAAAADGESDLESLTQLQIAWGDEGTEELLKSGPAEIVLRSYWAVSRAAKALPDNEELQSLAQLATNRVRRNREAMLENLGENLEDPTACFARLYITLAGLDDERLLAQSITNSEGSAACVQFARAVLSEAADIDPQSLIELANQGLPRDDAAVLTAAACRTAGVEKWDEYRRQMASSSSGGPLSADVVVLISRLNGDNPLW